MSETILFLAATLCVAAAPALALDAALALLVLQMPARDLLVSLPVAALLVTAIALDAGVVPRGRGGPAERE